MALEVTLLFWGGQEGLAFIFAILAIVGVSLTGDQVMAWSARRLARNNPVLTAPHRVTMTPETIVTVATDSSSQRDWQSFTSWLALDDLLVLNLNEKAGGTGWYLGRGEADDAAWAASRALITDRLGPPRRG